MSVGAYLDTIRDKPHHIRKRYAFWSALGVTAVIGLFWGASFTSSLPTAVAPHAATRVAAAQSSVSSTVAKAGTPAQSLVAGVGDLAKDIWTIITGPKKVKFAEIQATPGK